MELILLHVSIIVILVQPMFVLGVSADGLHQEIPVLKSAHQTVELVQVMHQYVKFVMVDFTYQVVLFVNPAKLLVVPVHTFPSQQLLVMYAESAFSEEKST